MPRTRIKVCGITRPADALAAEIAGCDAIGLVFWPQSPRYVTIDQATEITDCLSPLVNTVGVFVGATADEVADTVDCVGLRAAQICGELPRGDWQTLAKMVPLIRAVRVGDQPPGASDHMKGVADYLFDSADPKLHGGSGRAFDWSLLAHGSSFPRIWLAGGLNAANVGTAIQTVRPFAVDISTGVEESPGLKSAERIVEFVTAVHAADTHLDG
ncbi:MAG: phosphoribosylanthranilate isomerase [candidate division Zixibacteria bacterium]|nr:phosphoribosylanthranilate isomerase [candidate division Zixibacteria bacterium]